MYEVRYTDWEKKMAECVPFHIQTVRLVLAKLGGNEADAARLLTLCSEAGKDPLELIQAAVKKGMKGV